MLKSKDSDDPFMGRSRSVNAPKDTHKKKLRKSSLTHELNPVTVDSHPLDSSHNINSQGLDSNAFSGRDISRQLETHDLEPTTSDISRHYKREKPAPQPMHNIFLDNSVGFGDREQSIIFEQPTKENTLEHTEDISNKAGLKTEDLNITTSPKQEEDILATYKEVCQKAREENFMQVHGEMPNQLSRQTS